MAYIPQAIVVPLSPIACSVAIVSLVSFLPPVLNPRKRSEKGTATEWIIRKHG